MNQNLLPSVIENGIVTNEFAFYNPNDPRAIKDANWDMTSGTLFLENGKCTTGIPDAANNSAIFRMNTKKLDYGDVDIELRFMNKGLVTTVKTPAKDHDGLHIWLRYQSETLLYVVSANRRDNTIIIKKKVTGGPNPSNGGTYYELSKYVPFVVPLNVWQEARVECKSLEGGKVLICLSVGGKVIVSAVDDGVSHGGPALTSLGKIGIRGDNARLIFDKFVVS